LEIRDLVKDHQALRPLRLRELLVTSGRVVSVTGLDAQGAEMLVHLVTGAAVPDQGDVVLFGTNTRDIPDADAWLSSLDGLGLVSHRAVLLGMLSVLQNVAMPLTLDLDPIDPSVRPAVEALAREAGIPERAWDRPLGQMDAETAMRVRLARALAPDPRLVIVEHPSAALPRDAVAALARHVSRVMSARQVALVTLTADPTWAESTGGEMLTLSPGTGELAPSGGLLKRLTRVFGGRS
ncbi:MAG: hypothetical protein OEW19_19330, partial [Acidobacteriota bacterium]|nr:hypothetical protein [Acidobacteriota bacterium]